MKDCVGLLILFLIFIILAFLIVPIFVYKKKESDVLINCNLNTTNIVKGDGYFIIPNILQYDCLKKLKNNYLETARKNKNLNEYIEFSFYREQKFLNELSKIVGHKLFPVNSIDQQRCWIRYYFGGMKANYYENLHQDRKRYGSHVKQYRVLIPIYDTSDTRFTIANHGTIRFEENMGVIIEAENCLHKVEIKTGERLLLIMDYITEDCDTLGSHYSCRNIDGYFKWIVDTVWRGVSTVYYKILNN